MAHCAQHVNPCIACALAQVLYPGTYAPNLQGCHVEMGCLGALLTQKQPKLAAHLTSCGCEPSLLTTDWYLCLFATSLPPETAARVWDGLFSEGRKVLHRTGLALLSMVGPQLMKLDNPGALTGQSMHGRQCAHQRDLATPMQPRTECVAAESQCSGYTNPATTWMCCS
jgi:hypothetical protein